MERIYPNEIESKFPTAIAAMGLNIDELEQTDLVFYVRGGMLFSESRDERNAFRFNPPFEWEEVPYPLR